MRRPFALFIYFMLIGLIGCGGVPYTKDPLYPISAAPGKYTVAFLRYYKVPGKNLPAVAYANDVAKNYRKAGEGVYVVKAGTIAYVCLGSFNEPDGAEAKRTLERAKRYVGSPNISTSATKQAKGTAMIFEPEIVEIDFLKKLEAGASIIIIKDKSPGI